MKKIARRKTEKKHLSEATGKDKVFRRSLFYAICLFVVYQVMLVPLQIQLYALFWIAAVIGLFVVLSELLYSRFLADRQPVSIADLVVLHPSQMRWREHTLHHVILPTLLYVCGVLFLFFNRVRLLDQMAVVLLSGSFFVMFANIAATYHRLYSVSRMTHVVFDFITIIVYYFFVDVLINLVRYEGWDAWQIFAGAGMLTFILIGMMATVAKQSSTYIAIGMLLTGVIVGGAVACIWYIPVFNIAVISVIATVAFYLADVFWHHRLEGSFSWDTMLQYALYALMAVILLLYL